MRLDRVEFLRLGLSLEGERRLERARDRDRSRAGDLDRLLCFSFEADLRRDRSLASGLSLDSLVLSLEMDRALLDFLSDLRVDLLCSRVSFSFDADLLLDFLSESRFDSRLLFFTRPEVLSSRLRFLLYFLSSSSPLVVLMKQNNYSKQCIVLIKIKNDLLDFYLHFRCFFY